MEQAADVLICGAGIAGVATAYYLAKNHGITNILLVDPQAPLSQTTAKSGENYRNWWPYPPLVDFTNHSIDLMESLAAETNNLFQMQRRGYLYVSKQTDVDTVVGQLKQTYASSRGGTLRLHHDSTAGNNYVPQLDAPFGEVTDGADLLTDRNAIHRSFPHLAADISVAVHVRRAGAISVQLLGGYLLEQAKGQGVRSYRGEVTAIHTDGHGIKQVTIATPNGEQIIQTRTVINAAGAFLPQITRMVGLELPVFSIFQQKIAMPDPRGILPRNAPFTIFLDPQAVAWQDDERTFWQSDDEYAWLLDQFPGGLHIRPEGSGDSTWIKLGWAINNIAEVPIWTPKGTPEFPELLIRGAARFIPGLAQYAGRLPQPVVHYGGYYTKTKENLPLIGATEVPGLYVVGALSGYGTMAGCAAGELCATWVAGGAMPDYAEVLSLARYTNPAYQSIIATLEETGEL